jgi:hypothetical protein
MLIGPARLSLTALLVAALAACTPGGMMPAPSPTPAEPVGYPGWPPDAAPSDVLPIPVLSEIVVGHNRFLLNLVDNANQSLVSPARPVQLNFYDLAADAAVPAASAEGTYLPISEGRPGLYRAEVEFTRAGDWGLEVVTSEADDSSRSGRMIFSVRETGSTPAIGASAPASATPTAETPAEIAQISTDRQPLADFYRLSIDEALAAGRPFLVVFATPAFCKTATCGPALDIVKSVAPDYAASVEFIHVEPYELQLTDGHLQPVVENGQLVPVEAVREWGLLTEPYIAVVAADGTVSAKLEGVASAEEIRAALEEVAAD